MNQKSKVIQRFVKALVFALARDEARHCTLIYRMYIFRTARRIARDVLIDTTDELFDGALPAARASRCSLGTGSPHHIRFLVTIIRPLEQLLHPNTLHRALTQ